MTPPRLNKIAGSEASLSCKVTGAKDYKITWSFAGGKLKSKVRLSKLGDELFIPQLSIKDAGAYICRATNTFGHVKTKSSILRVFGKFLNKRTILCSCTFTVYKCGSHRQ